MLSQFTTSSLTVKLLLAKLNEAPIAYPARAMSKRYRTTRIDLIRLSTVTLAKEKVELMLQLFDHRRLTLQHLRLLGDQLPLRF